MKKLNLRSFYFLIAGLAINLLVSVIEFLTTDFNDPELTKDLPEFLKSSYTPEGMITSLIISALIVAYFAYRAVQNKKVAQGQKYIVVLIVFHIIGALGNLSVISTSFIVAFSFVGNIAILYACFTQRKYIEPEVEVENDQVWNTSNTEVNNTDDEVK